MSIIHFKCKIKTLFGIDITFVKKKKRLIAYDVECKLEKRLRKLATNSVYLREEGD